MLHSLSVVLNYSFEFDENTFLPSDHHYNNLVFVKLLVSLRSSYTNRTSFILCRWYPIVNVSDPSKFAWPMFVPGWSSSITKSTHSKFLLLANLSFHYYSPLISFSSLPHVRMNGHLMMNECACYQNIIMYCNKERVGGGAAAADAS